MANVLVIDSDAGLRIALASALTGAGHEVETTSSAKAGLAIARVCAPEVIVFELVLPDGDGLDLCRGLRADPTVRAALLVLTGANDEELRVRAFEAGADDFLAKPASMREFVLRVRALGRRKSKPPTTEVLSVGALRINRAARRVDVAGLDVDLTRREFDLLLYLAERPGRVQTRDALVVSVWGEVADSGRVVDTTIKRLRKKLGEASPALRTIRGVGYKLE